MTMQAKLLTAIMKNFEHSELLITPEENENYHVSLVTFTNKAGEKVEMRYMLPKEKPEPVNNY
jgi:hypothetical protein